MIESTVERQLWGEFVKGTNRPIGLFMGQASCWSFVSGGLGVERLDPAASCTHPFELDGIMRTEDRDVVFLRRLGEPCVALPNALVSTETNRSIHSSAQGDAKASPRSSTLPWKWASPA